MRDFLVLGGGKLRLVGGGGSLQRGGRLGFDLSEVVAHGSAWRQYIMLCNHGWKCEVLDFAIGKIKYRHA